VATESAVVAHLRRKYDPAAIVLVGSRADGQARSGSDWDLYVILRGGQTGFAGPVPRPEELDGELLDVGLVYLPAARESVLEVFGPNLQQARVLLDDADGVARAICEVAQEAYRRGRGLSSEETEQRRHGLARNLARMRFRADEPGAFFEALAFFFYAAHRYWYEVLHDRWSQSVHRALPEIAERDPAFHADLLALIEERGPGARVAAAERLFGALFPG
jgi:hypothetical protein